LPELADSICVYMMLDRAHSESFNSEVTMQAFQNTTALRSHMENQVNFFTELSHKSYDALRRVSEINLRLAQQLLQDSVDTGRAMLSCSDPFQMSATAMRQAEPVARHVRSYQKELLQVLTGAQSDLVRTTESRMPEASRSAAAMADEFARSAAEASEAFTTRH
jgi:phasin family protein